MVKKITNFLVPFDLTFMTVKKFLSFLFAALTAILIFIPFVGLSTFFLLQNLEKRVQKNKHSSSDLAQAQGGSSKSEFKPSVIGPTNSAANQSLALSLPTEPLQEFRLPKEVIKEQKEKNLNSSAFSLSTQSSSKSGEKQANSSTNSSISKTNNSANSSILASLNSSSVVASVNSLASQETQISQAPQDNPNPQTPAPTQPQGNPERLKAGVENILGAEKNNFAVYFHNMKTGEKFDISGNQQKPPASISKLPAAILTLHSIDSGEFSWETTYQLDPNFKYIKEDPMYAYGDYKYFYIGEYMRNLIVGSDNTAMRHLENLHGGPELYQQKLLDRLGIKLTRSPHITTAADVGYVFEGIYNQTFLSKESNEYLLKLLTTDTKWNSDRLDLALRIYPEAVVAHKIGQVTTTNGVSYHDAGIVYGPKTDFVLVVLNEDVTPDIGIEKIVQITRYLYQETNT